MVQDKKMKLFFEAELNILDWIKKMLFLIIIIFLFCQQFTFFFFNLDLTKTKIQFSKKYVIVRAID